MSRDFAIWLPDKVDVNFIMTFIRKMNAFYQYDNAQRPGFFLRFTNVKRIDILGVLLLYKFLEYSIIRNCFINPTTIDIKVINPQIKEFGFDSLIASCYTDSKKMEEEYGKLQSRVTNNFLVSPISIFKGLVDRDAIERKCFNAISKFYGTGNVSDMILMVISELIGNFYSHSEDDSRSIIVAYGTNDYVEVACADTGKGIIESLKPYVASRDNLMIMKKAFQKGVSSKPGTDHMGYGLWMLDETVKRNGGRMIVYSQDVYYERLGTRVSVIPTPLWRGTIVYLKLFTRIPVSVKDIIPVTGVSKINFR